MKYPTRSRMCSHLQCFDAQVFFGMNTNKDDDQLVCPVCTKQIHSNDLVIDGYFSQISHLTEETREIGLKPNGSWYPITDKSYVNPKSDIIILDEDNKRKKDRKKACHDLETNIFCKVRATRADVELNEKDFHFIEIKIMNK